MKRNIVFGIIWLVMGTVLMFVLVFFMKGSSNSCTWLFLIAPLFMYFQGVSYLMGMNKSKKDR
jgi:hypothetical protein